MNTTDKLASALRQAYAAHTDERGDKQEPLTPWDDADPQKREEWRAIARAARYYLGYERSFGRAP